MSEKNKFLLIYPVQNNTFLHKSVKIHAQLDYKNQAQMTYGRFKAKRVFVPNGLKK